MGSQGALDKAVSTGCSDQLGRTTDGGLSLETPDKNCEIKGNCPTCFP